MARKTAMGKEPGNVSIALPQSEKDRLAGKKPVVSPPVKEQLKRMSPGVYRNSQGKLVGSKGQGLPKPSLIQNALQGAVQGAGQQAGMQPGQRQQISPEAVNAGMQAGDLVNSAIRDYQPNMGNQTGQMIGNMQTPNYGDARTLNPQERAARGIDPRDPNIYSIMPNGQVMGTLMGWSPNMNTGPVQPLLNRMAPQQPQQQQQQPQQPGSVSGLLQRYR